MTQLTTAEIKAELEKQITEMLAEFEKESGAKVTDVRYLDAGILSESKPFVHIVTEVKTRAGKERAGCAKRQY